MLSVLKRPRYYRRIRTGLVYRYIPSSSNMIPMTDEERREFELKEWRIREEKAWDDRVNYNKELLVPVLEEEKSLDKLVEKLTIARNLFNKKLEKAGITIKDLVSKKDKTPKDEKLINAKDLIDIEEFKLNKRVKDNKKIKGEILVDISLEKPDFSVAVRTRGR